PCPHHTLLSHHDVLPGEQPDPTQSWLGGQHFSLSELNVRPEPHYISWPALPQASSLLKQVSRRPGTPLFPEEFVGRQAPAGVFQQAARGQRIIRSPGSAARSSFTPASVTLVWMRLRYCKLLKSFSSFNPASVTWVCVRSSFCKLLKSFSSFNPPSVTAVLPR